MMRYARIDGGVVVEFIETELDIATLFHPDMKWVQATEAAQVGWVYDGKEISPAAPPQVSLDELKAKKIEEINDAYVNVMAPFSVGYPQVEQQSWPIQVMESAAVLAGAGVDTPWIEAAAVARGIPLEEMATKIRDMDVQYRQASGALTGKRQALRDLVDAAASAEQLAAISWPTESTS